ncbi:PDZ domain-containing protein [Streptomyces sp. NPDC005481]|uniref:PDZ domain-containing protein n=1 Tax=Streptomyces sp. NPDC005481 TaxID=3154881 RepID=UPI0033B600AB
MEQTALRPKPMPGREPGDDPPTEGAGKPCGRAPHRPHAARRRGRRLMTLFFGLFVGTALVLSGVGLGTVGATVIGMSKLAALQKQAGAGAGAGAPGASGPSGGPSAGPSASDEHPGGPGKSTGRDPSVGSMATGESPAGRGSPPPAEKPARATLGVEAVDAPGGAGALVVGVHVPGPGYSAGLVRGDVLTALGATRVASADALARAVADARPGSAVTLTVRRAGGGQQRLTARPGVVT